MNKEKYKKICSVCDKILLAQDSTVERIAISWLHVIREHPVFLTDYANVFIKGNSFFSFFNHTNRVLLYKLRWFLQYLKVLILERSFKPNKLQKNIDVLIVSNIVNKSHAGQVNDFYFSSLPSALVFEGRSVVIALINQSGMSGAYLNKKWDVNSVPRVILSRLLGFFNEIALHSRLKKESSNLMLLARKENNGLLKNTLIKASEEALSNITHSNLRISIQIGTLVEKLKPKVILLTHEGHAWERVVFAAARNSYPDVICVGYLHAALFRFQHAIRRNLAPQYNPDKILVSGESMKTQLEESHALKDIPIAVLGSNRNFDKNTFSNIDKNETPSCLVLPEGLESECNLLFEYSIECALLCPEVKFVWRLHPIMNFEKLRLKNSKLNYLPNNIILSNNTFSNDVLLCQIALYRGSTAIIQAGSSGLLPIYYQHLDELTIDPLYVLNNGIKVTSALDFSSVVDKIKSNTLNKSDINAVRNYCNNFYSEMDSNVLVNIIDSKI